jgi:predicted NBD/HSP70 family sugar kinase
MCQLLEVASLSVLDERLRDAGQQTAAMWESTEGWDFDRKLLEDWVALAADGLAHAIASACSVIDFGAVRIDGWLPLGLRAELVEAVKQALARLDLSGLTIPDIEPGHIGPDARALGAASLPLSGRFLID